MDRGEKRSVMSVASDSGAPPRPVREAWVVIEGIRCAFADGQEVVRGLSLAIGRGEVVALLGPSGCGKSTLLRAVAGFAVPQAGDVRIAGRSIMTLPPHRRPVNLMFQSYALFPHMTVEQNIAFGLRQMKRPAAEVAARVDALLGLVRMEAFRHRRPHQLSGGQQQRVALARSLAREPHLLLLDEPMGALDRKLRTEMQFELGEILRRIGATCLMVTHDPEEAMVMADRLALMCEGEIVQQGVPHEVYARPASRFAAAFLGPVNCFDAVVAGMDGDEVLLHVRATGQDVRVPVGAPVAEGTAVSLALRPEQLTLQRAGQGLRAERAVRVTIEDVAQLGSQTTYRVRLADGSIMTVREAGGRGVAVLEGGESACLSWHPGDAVVLRS